MPIATPRFQSLLDRAAALKGGEDALRALLPAVKSSKELIKISDDRWLAGMTKRVFQAGFSWRVIETKWLGFEDAFHGFDLGRCAAIHDEEMDQLLSNKQIVRHGQKIDTVRRNAAFLIELGREYGTGAAFFADYPSTHFVELLGVLKKRGARLGGATAQYFLRGMGKDSLLFSPDVTRALIREGIVDKAPSSQRDLKAVQTACNDWMEETGLPLSHISRILAATVDAPSPFEGPRGARRIGL